MTKEAEDKIGEESLCKVPNPPNMGRVSSPQSTGGAGTIFEQHVDAYWLAQLLVGSIPPILHDCAVKEVHLQTEHLGWHTDDFLVVGENGSGRRRSLAGQVKRSFTLSATNEECSKTIHDFWRDFKNTEQFSPARDRLALVTLRGTNTLLEYLCGLLDCSRAARDEADFERRLGIGGFVHAKSVAYCDQIRQIIGEIEERDVSAADVWPFLRVLHVLSVDLNNATRQTEAMMKSLLAFTTDERDPVYAADASWNLLLSEVGGGMPVARSYLRHQLPESLLERHSPIGAGEERALRTLSDHSAPILEGIRPTIGDELHLERGRLVQQVIEQLQTDRVVLISGAAGIGKSVIAKDATRILAADHFVFTFRAEEFAHPHLDQTLQSAQIPANATTLAAILAGQTRKVLLIDSVERLLEASTRDAFTDLLTLASRDPSWRLVLTCREYSADLVQASFLAPSNVGYTVLTIPPLDDEDLQEVEAAYPELSRPLADSGLRRLLRNPYVLNRALQIRWSERPTLPRDEREFRTLFWEEIVRADHRVAAGTPRRREEALMKIALRRARALTLYAPCDDLDPEVVSRLQSESLVVCSETSKLMLAPAHDVLEDWAIYQWIEERRALLDTSLQDLGTEIGTHPAVRRTYRKWAAELVHHEPHVAGELFRGAIKEEELPQHFRDDTLVSLLLSPSSPSFLEAHTAELFADDKYLLRRVIHLLRVACVTVPSWLGAVATRGSLFTAPDGPAWACVLRMVNDRIVQFTEEDSHLLLGFIEDWAQGVSWQTPYPEGSQPAAAIALWLLSIFDDFRSKDERIRALKVIAKVPRADPEGFASLLQGSPDAERDRTVADFREIIFEGLDGMPAARDMPEIIVSVTRDHLMCSEEAIEDSSPYHGGLELESLFGINFGRSHDFFPASAYRGPFLALLMHHQDQGLDLIVDILNRSADWYAHPRVPSRHIERPFEITLTFADGTSRKQWCNERLWNLYRGTSVGPYVLQSLLMAMERALLEFASEHETELDSVLLGILRTADTAALTAVVASVATAFPHASGETLLALLRSPMCIRLDKQRLHMEVQSPSKVSRMMPLLDASRRLHDQERAEADARPHRSQDLEFAILNLQLGPLGPRVHEALDRNRAEMPADDEQTKEDRLWRLAMHRMDLRHYEVTEPPSETVPGLGTPEVEKREQYIQLDPRVLEGDIAQMAAEAGAKLQSANAGLGLLMWGVKVFAQEEDGAYDPAEWRTRLAEAQTLGKASGLREGHDVGAGAPGFVAAVCVRDHWSELSHDERDWCVHQVCLEVERDKDQWSHFARVQRNTMSADRPCSSVLPVLAGKALKQPQASRVWGALAMGLTHPINEVRSYAAGGIGLHLWVADPELARRCVGALAEQAVLVQEAWDAEASRPYAERQKLDSIEANVANEMRRRLLQADSGVNDAYQQLNTGTWLGAEANAKIIAILVHASTEAIAIDAFERLALTLVAWWRADRDRRRTLDPARPERNSETESTLTELLAAFLLRTNATAGLRVAEPIVDAMGRHPDEVSRFLSRLIGIEDREPNTAQFWSLWERFAEAVKQAPWLGSIDRRAASGQEMISMIFLGNWWKEEVSHWRSLEGYAEHIHRLFRELPLSATVLDCYVRFLFRIGERSLPEAFVYLAKRLGEADPRMALANGNTVFLLEALLGRYVYGKPLQLKQRKDLRDAVLLVLDLLVEMGSSAAFRMRDDFVTPGLAP